jgi:cytoskeletal protein CcmA (bactofilin family)
MWRKSEDSKLNSSPDPSVQHSGAALPSDSPATVSPGIKIKGEISGKGDLLLDGTFEGKVRLPEGTFTAGPNARITAEIEAREIIVRGEVTGTLKARERIQICSTGKLTGDMDTRGIMIEDGAVLHSKVAVPQTVPQPAGPQAAAPGQDQAPQPPRQDLPPRTKGASSA